MQTKASTRHPEADSHGHQPSGSAAPAGEERSKKRKWYSLYDKVFALPNLEGAWSRVESNGGAGGVDGQTVARFAEDAQGNLLKLQQELQAKT